MSEKDGYIKTKNFNSIDDLSVYYKREYNILFLLLELSVTLHSTPSSSAIGMFLLSSICLCLCLIGNNEMIVSNVLMWLHIRAAPHRSGFPFNIICICLKERKKNAEKKNDLFIYCYRKILHNLAFWIILL